MMGEKVSDAGLPVQVSIEPGLRPPRKDVPEVSPRPRIENQPKALPAQLPEGGEQDRPQKKTVKSAEEVIKQFNEQFQAMQARGFLREVRMQVSISDEGMVSVKILDARTEKVIREIPPKDQAEFAKHLREAAGMVFDGKA